MPELPEVEVVRRGLADHVVGKAFARVSLRGTRVARRHVLGPEHLSAQITGARVRAVDRRGKYLWLVLEPAHEVAAQGSALMALIVHLGMSGQMLVQDCHLEAPKHTHAQFWLSDGPVKNSAEPISSEGKVLRFVDQRTFGGLALAELGAPSQGHPFGVPVPVAHIAPDPLEPIFDAEQVSARIRSSNSEVKRRLLDQGVVSGIGNIYADESLWRAGIHGQHRSSSLQQSDLVALLGHAEDVMRDALAQGGTSFDSLYVNVNGQSGYFDRSLDAYGREGKPCKRCGTLMRRIQFTNRSSTFCPSCQRLP
ncbi:bifunctional DNA-formamidopyrimidine glycosylase/DNA-(apurinic or apyrimidinic site) lyase [Dermatophilus congolensis]|uniref:bifunctional DNA-formamidopyrimidine glycosylase/DNA-(apurinic or apyrimidinic site) lyase n=1 Tax=Dermatophilus congolensis TaxID=1863 RepID=UPI001AAF72F3|nr:bifunctional DNA-formamidopyrimidine glycosylase/DNA-(apurinic or apyrimidinic site) lyase [Dermatophilus congolensis]MBO3132546.1 bifunctional DNA-formamidopyrimidine glycosylase/DNA-(apurinic or apyrimidinic site) lyase [Dermatophilus congolensis]MBO3133293.1 bifunctional DNA-formamidopyrimidine glycosylase/DNA-(apurinic or apyrimidinic site) lyase [Dermatophilus congolensis]MBO3135528.1 bifunctional DNA-formamidopyrimidine glycosylase/DNA-(apurinic or apyrimidinic site) lyase [Dermatophilu